MVYELRPKIKMNELTLTAKNKDIQSFIASLIEKKTDRFILCLESYPGVDEEKLLQLAESFKPALIINAKDCTLSENCVDEKLAQTLTEDRVFGLMTHERLEDYFDPEKLIKVVSEIKKTKGLVVVYGTGASIVAEKWDKLIYFDLTRWEIQKRFRMGLSNWLAQPESDNLKKFKRGYFFEWRIADRKKQELRKELEYLVDTTQNESWAMIDQQTYEQLQTQAVNQPFRLVPYFDQSPWGGQWMKEKFGLPAETPNYGWAFDGVPEENSLVFELSDGEFEMPAIDLVHNYPVELLGERVYSLFGKEFPIRFDYLDTMGGGNLSLQVHPRVEYIQEKFGMNYTQNESYYILEATEKSSIYLGLKNKVNKFEMIEELAKASQDSDYQFDDTKFVNNFPVKKHDHYSIPAGTVHCGGPDTVVLEISATPYIFTFKLWDWGRLGLDGKPRPIHLEHGSENIDERFDENYARAHLFSKDEIIDQTTELLVEKTGLCELEFIETHRYTFADECRLDTEDSVNMLNLVDGKEILLVSDDGKFAPITIHYGETFIVPKNCGKFMIQNKGEEPAMLLQAFVK